MSPKHNQEITEAITEQDNATEAKVESTESKQERIEKLLQSLKKAHSEKDERAGKKIRRQLRKLGYYISKVKKEQAIAEELEDTEE